MIIAAALAGVIVLMAAALIWAARLLYIGNLDMQALAELELRRRQSLERVHAVLVAEQTLAAPHG